MKVDFEKVGIIASYFADNTEGLYVTKLLKLFYYLDFISYNIRSSSITNDVYFRLPYGPVPTAIKNDIDILSSKDTLGFDFESQLVKFIGLESDKHNNGKLVINKNHDLNLRKLSNFEIDLVKHLAVTFKKTKAKVISENTHKEKPWLLTSENAVIDYELANELEIKNILPDFLAKHK